MVKGGGHGQPLRAVPDLAEATCIFHGGKLIFDCEAG